jgi:hypothetical protein
MLSDLTVDEFRRLREYLRFGGDKLNMLHRSDSVREERRRLVTILKFEFQPVMALDRTPHRAARQQAKQLPALFILHVYGRMYRVSERWLIAERARKTFDNIPRAGQGMPDAIDKFGEREITLSRPLFNICRNRQ